MGTSIERRAVDGSQVSFLLKDLRTKAIAVIRRKMCVYVHVRCWLLKVIAEPFIDFALRRLLVPVSAHSCFFPPWRDGCYIVYFYHPTAVWAALQWRGGHCSLFLPQRTTVGLFASGKPVVVHYACHRVPVCRPFAALICSCLYTYSGFSRLVRHPVRDCCRLSQRRAGSWFPSGEMVVVY